MHGTKASNYGVSECDLLIAVGVRFSDRVIGDAKRFASNAKILQFDVDPAEINKKYPDGCQCDRRYQGNPETCEPSVRTAGAHRMDAAD